ncbi:MAG: hypothetical protein JW709_13275 [Sedimentisphaerales bacterium]|nr:hypothetical protein [Sedimentisphaerales bacterium]
MNCMSFSFRSMVVLLVILLAHRAIATEVRDVYVIPNFHPACMGWLVEYARERNYCLNTYLGHLNKLTEDDQYKFVLSEIPHLIAMREFTPDRFTEFMERVKQGRCEAVNAFVVEPTVNLAGGEALIQQGIQGLQWYRQVMNLHPRYLWMIDTVGWHEQMAQITSGLGLDAMVYCRFNPTAPPWPRDVRHTYAREGSPLHWMQSPDGSRTLGVCVGMYVDMDFWEFFRDAEPLSDNKIAEHIQSVRENSKRYPDNFPVAALGGYGDYSPPFAYKNYPKELIEKWNNLAPDMPIHMATFTDYMNRIKPMLAANPDAIPTVTGSSGIYGWPAFWINSPAYKKLFRHYEHLLFAAEALATVAEMTVQNTYPAQAFSDAWMLLALNMDRNSLWGTAVDGPFEHEKSWDAMDRFVYINDLAESVLDSVQSTVMIPADHTVTLFNPLGQKRQTPFAITFDEGMMLSDADCQYAEDGRTLLVQNEISPLSFVPMFTRYSLVTSVTKTVLPDVIQTDFYQAKIDPETGALVSLKLNADNRELLAGPANVILAEGDANPHILGEKTQRKPLTTSSVHKPAITVTDGSLAIIVDIRSSFQDNRLLRRIVRFYRNSPRIDFVTETHGLTPGTILSAEFPLAPTVSAMYRAIPSGFVRGVWPQDISQGALTAGVIPVIGWSDYEFQDGGGMALLDRGTPAREVVDNTVYLLMQNASGAYYGYEVNWMNDKGVQRYEYALVPHADASSPARMAHLAQEYNTPVFAFRGRPRQKSPSFMEISDNLLLQALRRADDEVEIRLLETKQQSGSVCVTINAPVTEAWRTNLLGENKIPLNDQSPFNLKVKPQEIITLRMKTSRSVPPVKALDSFNDLIPTRKQAYMKSTYDKNLLGHPPTKGGED